VHLQDLGAVHQALAAERHQVRVGRAPVAQRRRPLLRPADVEGLLARRDHAAVGDPGDDRRHLTGSDGDHDLVEQRHALRGLAQPGQGLTPAEPGQRRQVLVAEALADLGGLAERGVGGGSVASGEAADRDRQEQVPVLGTVELSVVEQPLGSGQPTTAAGELAPVQQREAQPERGPGAPRHIAQAQPLVRRARPHLGAVVVPTDQVGGHRKPLEVRRRERGLAIQGRELVVGVRPSEPIERVPGPIEHVGRGHTLSLPLRALAYAPHQRPASEAPPVAGSRGGEIPAAPQQSWVLACKTCQRGRANLERQRPRGLEAPWVRSR
jgi:hypothetical protein